MDSGLCKWDDASPTDCRLNRFVNAITLWRRWSSSLRFKIWKDLGYEKGAIEVEADHVHIMGCIGAAVLMVKVQSHKFSTYHFAAQVLDYLLIRS